MPTRSRAIGSPGLPSSRWSSARISASTSAPGFSGSLASTESAEVGKFLARGDHLPALGQRQIREEIAGKVFDVTGDAVAALDAADLFVDSAA